MTDQEQAERKWELSKLDSAYLIEELYLRGVSVRDIYGRYYEFEVASNARTMTKEDAELAGVIE